MTSRQCETIVCFYSEQQNIPPRFIRYSTGEIEVVSRLLSAADLQRIYLVFSSHLLCHPQLLLFFFTPISYEQQNKIRSNERKTAFLSSPISSNFQHQIPEAGAPQRSIHPPPKKNHSFLIYLLHAEDLSTLSRENKFKKVLLLLEILSQSVLFSFLHRNDRGGTKAGIPSWEQSHIHIQHDASMTQPFPFHLQTEQ